MSDQQFLHDLEKKLWTAADKLRSTLDAAQYKHAVLGLLFVKYVSDAFDIRRQELIAQFQNEKHGYYLNLADFPSPEEYQAEIAAELEIRDYYTEKNVFWVPHAGRRCKTTLSYRPAPRLRSRTAKPKPTRSAASGA
ncbi:MAG: type I restriction-modification system subunit M N-terminal domain-containing protein [Desulfobulbus sp.]|nr:type I restriction-modification system subunit M N-terminal domain-containing protein [Desulfobulbus sp.]